MHWREENEKGRELYNAFLDVITTEQMHDLSAILISRALAGDVEAARLVIEYAFATLSIDTNEEEKEDWE